MADEGAIRKAWSDYNAATVQMQKCLPTKNGGKSAEKRWAVAYQKLVALGEMPQIRGKYRADK